MFVFSIFQHQQQVAAAVERAKQVTMTELNAIIGVSSLFNLSVIICIPLTRKHDQWQCAVDIEFSHN